MKKIAFPLLSEKFPSLFIPHRLRRYWIEFLFLSGSERNAENLSRQKCGFWVRIYSCVFECGWVIRLLSSVRISRIEKAVRCQVANNVGRLPGKPTEVSNVGIYCNIAECWIFDKYEKTRVCEGMLNKLSSKQRNFSAFMCNIHDRFANADSFEQIWIRSFIPELDNLRLCYLYFSELKQCFRWNRWRNSLTRACHQMIMFRSGKRWAHHL